METPDFIPRSSYLNRVLPFIGKPLIKVFTGQRRSGKSYIMLQTIDYIRLKHPDATIIYINKEHPDYDGIRDDLSLWNYVKERKPAAGQCFVFIDEIQEIANFEKAVRGMIAQGCFDVYCTGSNATMLSGELATMLSGRYVEIKIHCLSYGEYLLFHKLDNTPEAMWKYMQEGGLPFLIHLEDNTLVRQEYLRNVLNTILFRDIVQRFNVRNFSFLNNLMAFIADNTGSLISANRISGFLKSQHIAISARTILEYLHFLESSYLIHRVKRYDIAGKRLFEVNDKFYFEDLGLSHIIKAWDPKNIHKYIESMVYRHLLQDSWQVYVGKLADKEIDFIATKDDQTIYVQVALSVAEEKTFEREFGNLLLIRDNFKKFVVTLDAFARGNHRGIELMNLRDFLLEIP